LGDETAAEAVDRIDYDFKRIHRTSLPASNQYLVALRAKQLDDWCADFLVRYPDSVVLHLGCGLDGRAFRLAMPPAVRWFDIDQPAVVGLRRRLYDDTERYRMIGSSVTDPQWLDHIPNGCPTLVVAGGLLMYLQESEVRQLFERMIDRFDSVSCNSTRSHRWDRGCQSSSQKASSNGASATSATSKHGT
jgi:O-methyltransferase involved in polyketide biosynthesis